ncbi:hypothetical protein KAX29_07210 [candidate division WOR-3 bacterium]|nr:hypothetical protein [candidate division WOR-3 bacterium]
MAILSNVNERVKRFSIIDIKLIQCTAMFITLIVVKLIPGIMNINIWWFVILLVISVIKPIYVMYIKK